VAIAKACNFMPCQLYPLHYNVMPSGTLLNLYPLPYYSVFATDTLL